MANASKLQNGSFEEKVSLYKNSGMTNVEDFVKNQRLKEESIKNLKKNYEQYQQSLGEKKFNKLVANLMTKNSNPIVDSLHLIQAYPLTKTKKWIPSLLAIFVLRSSRLA